MKITAGKQRTPKTVKLVDLVKRFPRNTWWLNFNAFGFDTYGPRRRRERGFQFLRTKKRTPTWREGVRQVMKTVRRNIGAQNDICEGQYTRIRSSGYSTSGAQLRCWRVVVRHPKWAMDAYLTVLTWYPTLLWNVEERFRTKRRILGKKKSEWVNICELE